MSSVDCEIDIPDLLDVQQVAAKLQCSARHVYRLSSAGQMPASCKIGTLVRWRRRAIEEWIEDGCPSVRIATKTN